MNQTLRDLAEKLGCHLLGDGSVTVTGVSSLQSATHESLVFVEDAQHLDAALALAPPPPSSSETSLPETSPPAPSKPLLISAQPRLAFARAAQASPRPRPQSRHSSFGHRSRIR